ncbi:MAG: hydrogenase iron-sulfur subunit [Candidatus Methanospirareceae archaeon]
MGEEFEPKIVGFTCNWCTYAGADLAGTSRIKYPPNIRIIRLMCSGRVDPMFVLRALLNGADGVFIGGCHPGDCHYMKGNYFARRRIAALKAILKQYGLENRVRLEWISASEGQKFANVMKEMVEDIKKLGPNPMKGKIL